MTAFEIIFGIVLLLASLAIILVVILQEGHQQNMGAITGGADTFLAKNKAAQWMRFYPGGRRSLQLDFLSCDCIECFYVFCKIIRED